MKNNKGITLTSLIIYIIALLFLVGTMSTLTKYFYKNFDNLTIDDNAAKDYGTLNNYLSNDINSGKVENVMTTDDGSVLTIKLDNFVSHRYKFEDNSIFYLEIQNNQVNKKVSICKKVTSCNFSITNKVINLNLVLNAKNTYNTSYTIK